MLELAVQAGDPVAMGATAVGLTLAAFFSGLVVERKRNGRRNNPGPDANDYRYGGKPGSDWKAGRGEICKKHGEDISAAQATIQALGGSQAAIHQSQTETRKEIGELRRETAASFRGLHARLDAALSRQDMSHKDP